MISSYTIPFCISLLIISCKICGQTEDSLKNAIQISYSYTHFERQFSKDWHTTAIEYKRRTGFGPVVGRCNFSSRLEKTGFQFEAEAYPKISPKIYTYVSLGFSNAFPVFSRARAAHSTFIGFSKGWEAEGGVRYLRFDKNVWVFTGGLSKYAGHWLLNVKTFITPSDVNTDQSYFLMARRYLKNGTDFMWLQVGRGISPDENRNIQLLTSSKLGSTRFTSGAQFTVGSRTMVNLELGWSRNEYQTKTYDNQLLTTVGLLRKF